MLNIITALIGITLAELIFISMIIDGDQVKFEGFEFLNPKRNYCYWTSCNWFGVIFITLLLNILCPILSIGYWLYKLCTFGRK